MRVNLAATFDADGTTRVRGVIRIDDPERRQNLVARGTGQSSCADSDGDGTGGLTRLAAEFRDARTKRPVQVVLRSPPTQDIDASGVYLATLTVGDSTTTLAALIGVERDRS